MEMVEYKNKEKSTKNKLQKCKDFFSGKLPYEEQEKIYAKLGARKFQKVVFKAEKVKFKVLKTLWPNFINTYEKHLDKKCAKEVAKSHSLTMQDAIKNKYKSLKYALRKEFYQEKNRNYHLDLTKPNEMYQFAKWNKSIHMRGLKREAITIPVLLGMTALGVTPAAPFLALEAASAFVDFQCVNLQNYTIARLKPKLEKMQRISVKKAAQKYNKYGEVIENIHQAKMDKDDVLTIDDILKTAKNKEQLNALKELVTKELAAREANNKNKENNKINVKKGMI